MDLASLISFFAFSSAKLLAFVAFLVWVHWRRDYQVFRRWRAAAFIGTASGILAIAGATLLFHGSFPAANWQWADYLAQAKLLATGVISLTCFFMPMVFLITFGMYIRYLHGLDIGLGGFEWLDRIWRNPRAPAGPPPLVHEERYS